MPYHETKIILRKFKIKRVPTELGTIYVLITFKMVSSSDFSTAVSGKVVTSRISKNGSSFILTSNQAKEIGSGWYKILIAIDDLRESIVILSFTASGCCQNDIVFIKGVPQY